MEPVILDTKIIGQFGAYVRLRRWLRGIHPTRGYIIRGLTGWETVEEKDVLRPLHFFKVEEGK